MSSTANTIVQVLIVVAVLGLLVSRRFRPRPIRGDRRRWQLPIALIAFGVYSMIQLTRGSHPISLTGTDLGYLAVGGAISAVLGLLRGTTVRIYREGGVLLQRYTAATAALWVATILVRLGIDAGAPSFGVAKTVAGASIMFMFGLSLLGESAVVAARTGGGLAAPTLR
jgi:hypothetical protein